ncbi:hypothetical protein CSC14_1548 [Proteus mirabilis]|nr:hypothetical protein BB2000_3455 [Proteus mirabilis BB2000]PVF72186.1 hypothetical protein CSC14_1548 [Proteus mirabilis]
MSAVYICVTYSMELIAYAITFDCFTRFSSTTLLSGCEY